MFAIELCLKIIYIGNAFEIVEIAVYYSCGLTPAGS